MRGRGLGVVLAAGACACGLGTGGARVAAAAPPPPHGPHPRIALTEAVRAALKAKVTASDSAAHAAVETCEKAAVAPGAESGYQGLDWAGAASACALAYQLTGNAAHARRGVTLWRALLEDVERIGDRKACVAGASPKQARASVQRDTGYAIRFIGLHTALAYDWLHDAPGVDEALRAQSRACFTAWIDWYTKDGYLRDTPGANYHAGFVAAKALIAIATSGEDRRGDAGARFFAEVVDDVFAQQIVANGLGGDSGGIPARAGRGALVGGDWAEGWQYGPLSVIEYALAARALEEQGASWPEVRAWADDVTLRFIHGLPPGRKGMYVGGDTDHEGPFLEPTPGPLLATVIGPGSDRVAGLAVHLAAELGKLRYGPPVFGALAEARGVAPADPAAAGLPPVFLARGTRSLYVRSSWRPDALWAVFTSAPAVVPDHQHRDASNFVLSRGADPLIVDASPYGTRSSLTGNALTVDSDAVLGDYKPSQTPTSTADLPWVRATASGVFAARAEIEGAFKFADTPSDVPLARRDWVFLPEGEVVVLDRVETGGARRAAYVRFRTLAKLTMTSTMASMTSAGAPPVAHGRVGASAVAIHAALLRPPAAPAVTAIPRGECTGSFGACTAARFAVGEYAVKIAGAQVIAAHVIDALEASEAPADVAAVDQPGVVGAAVRRGAAQTFVIAPAVPRLLPPETLVYAVPGDRPARHVVFDPPDAGTDQTAVRAAATPDGRCRVTLSRSDGARVAARPAVFVVGPARSGTNPGCLVTEEAEGATRGEGAPPIPSAEPRSKTVGGCGCAVTRSDGDLGEPILAAAFFFIAVTFPYWRKPARRRH